MKMNEIYSFSVSIERDWKSLETKRDRKVKVALVKSYSFWIAYNNIHSNRR